jgi:2,3-bisphosphoglycerate-dependent phosphoglycerate mutase
VRRVVLVRHCESSGPEPDAPLTPAGAAQAVALAARLAALDVDHVVSSPLARARESIGPFARATGLAVTLDPRLVERRLAPAPVADFLAEVRRGFDDPEQRLPGGESARDACERGRAVLDELLASAHRLPLAATHGQLLGLVLRSIDGRFGFAEWRALANPDVFVVERDGAGTLRFARLDPVAPGMPVG